ncbi:protoporphyrinogen oxidase [Paenibacillus sp. CC-CFT747]|nr:protoporphyrinogen oxidase [Paenibacillus sp. CC-CFT747]
MQEAARKVMIIGGGITGLSAAFYVQKLFKEKGVPVEITLVEKSGKWGGRIETLRRDGFVLEKGPDSFLARKLPIIELSRDLGIENELVGQGAKGKRSYILHHGKLHPMPAGMVLAIPTDLTAFMETGLVSPEGKARALEDLTLPKSEDPGDESLGHFLSRRLGPEVLENIAEPLLAGIYAGDTYALSLQATFPQFKDAEQKYGSLIQGMQESRKASAASAESQEAFPEAARGSMFLSYRNGLQSLVDALHEALQGVKRLTAAAVKVDRTESGSRVTMDNGEVYETDSLILALPNYTMAELLPELPAVQRLGQVDYISVANVILAYNAEEIETSFDGSGFVIPRKEGRFITACTWTSTKWCHIAPPDKVVLRCYVGRSGEEGWTGMTDEEIVEKVKQEVRELMGIEAEPLFHEINRLYRSMPQYPVGHLDQIREARKELQEKHPGVFVTGSGFHGVGLPDCIRQGREAAEECLLHLAGTGTPGQR